MGKKYQQLSLEERCTIARLSENGQTIRQIAAVMDRSPSTIARELARNANAQAPYQPAYAQQISKSRRWKGSRLIRNPELQQIVLQYLRYGCSPEQVSGRLARDLGHNVISHESIYRFIYAQIARTKNYAWRLYLPRAKSKRGLRGKKGGSPATFIFKRVSIHKRPAHVQSRKQPGHWEADLMLFSKYGQALLVAHERSSRLVVLKKQPSKASRFVAKHLKDLFAALPQKIRKTITFDNGTEFALHHQLHSLGTKTFFCDTHSPWQKGGVENAIGRMRRGLPRKTDLAKLSLAALNARVAAYNHTPRKCLAYRTPAEVFSQQVLHFKCESTSPPSRG